MTDSAAGQERDIIALMDAISRAEDPGLPVARRAPHQRRRIERIAEALYKAGWRRTDGDDRFDRSLSEALNAGDGSYRP